MQRFLHCHEVERRVPASRRDYPFNSSLEPVFDDMVTLVAQCCQAPVALIFLTDNGRPAIKSNVQFDGSVISDVAAFCLPTMRQPNSASIVEDTAADARFADNPLVTSAPWIRFYAGAPLVASDGRGMGTLGVMDHTPRQFSPAQADALARLARCLVDRLSLVSMQNEVTERRRRETALQESEQKYRLLMEEATVGIFLANQEGRSVEANQHAREMLGYTQEELLSLSIPDLIPSEDLQAAPPRLDELRKGKTVISQRRLRHKNGMLVPVELRVRMLTDGRLLAIVEDLKTIHALLNALPDSALLITPEGETLTMNQVAAQRLGVKVEELLGRPIWESFPPTLAAARRVKVEEVVRTGQPVTFQDERDGRSFETRLYPMADAFGQVRRVAVFARDISRQKQAEAALQENERLFRIAIGTLDIAVFRQDLDLRYTWIYQPQLGYSPTQVVGKTDAELLPAADAVRVMAIKRRVLETRVGCREGVTVTSNSVSRYFELNLEPLQGDDGKVVGLLGATLDITAHKQVEEQLRASLQEKEVLLREIHHRVKNNLQIISSLLYLQAQKTDNQGLRNMLQESRNRIVSMSLIHEKLYQVTDLARITFTDYARELAQALFRSYGVNQANVALTIKGNDLTLDINRAVPCGLIINEVVSNSLKYAFPKGRRGAIRLALRLDQAQQCHFILSDNGVGMPQDFESRPRSSLGLTLIERLAEQLQGTLERSSSAQGTTYRLTFPREV